MSRKYILCAAAVVMFCAINTVCYGGQSSPEDNCGRYQLQDIKVGNEMVPFLLDTATGKIWMYQSDITTKKKFVGMSIEGLAYSREEKDADALNKQIEQWHFNNFIDKTTKGIKEKIFSEFSYDPDVEKAEIIYGKLKNKR